MSRRSPTVYAARILCVSVLAATAPRAQSDPQPEALPAGYRVETIATPKGVAFGVGGMDFADDGTLYCSTREGEVWTYVPASKQWHRFAEGLHEPLGVLVEQGTNRLFVMQRGELTELVDENGDGTADLFKTVCAAWGLTDNYHEYAFGLVRDAEGNFYGTLNTSLSWPGWAGSDRWDIGRVHDCKMGRAAQWRGWSFRITPEGEFQPWSCGLRSPCGIGMSPAGELFYTDNQGDWVATSGLHVLAKGRFHGHPSSLMDHPDYEGVDLNSIPVEKYGELRKLPAVWFPHGDLANSPGEPVFDTTGGAFGPFAGQIFCGDQSRSNVFRVVLDQVDGEYQGAAIDFADHLQSGIVRNRFAADGSLYLGQTGRGWGSRGPAKYGMQRIVWDGTTVPFSIHSIRLTKTGFDLRFTSPPDAARAVQAASYRIAHWGYLYRPEYGSPKVDRTEVAVSTAKLDADGVTVHLDLPTLATERVYEFTLDLGGADGGTLANRVAYYTLNRLRR